VNKSIGCKITANGKACGGCERGAADRQQRDAYALDVLFHMGLWDGVSTSATCPLTGKAFDLAVGQVDKANETAGYVPGNIVMTSLQGNQERGKMQQHYGDMAGAARYAADVARAGQAALVLRKCDVPAYPTTKRTKASEILPHERPASDMRNVRFGPYGS
jgi:hypothetical protein